MKALSFKWRLCTIYRDDPAISVAEDVCWWGDALRLPNIWRLAQAEHIEASMRFGAIVFEREDRFVLSRSARQEIAVMSADLSSAGTGVVPSVQEPELAQAL